MKLLYFSCHSVLEYDELKLFEELGINYHSLGSYVIPQKPQDPIRPPLTHTPDPWCVHHTPARNNVPKEFFDYFDVIQIMHVPEWIADNWEKIKEKVVIWRTIGQSTPKIEQMLFPYRQKGLKVIRYAWRESYIPDNIGSDKVIPFYKDPAEFGQWTGIGNEIITIAQDMAHRAEHCNYDTFLSLAKIFKMKIYGPNNERSGDLSGGMLTYEQMKQKLRDSRVYIYTGTQPASYTLNFVEALMTGIPVVALGPNHATSLGIAGDAYQIPDIIQNGVNGFWSDNINELQDRIAFLMTNYSAAKRIGQAGRETAVTLFGKDTVKLKWRMFFGI